jgi:hypothetical protein
MILGYRVGLSSRGRRSEEESLHGAKRMWTSQLQSVSLHPSVTNYLCEARPHPRLLACHRQLSLRVPDLRLGFFAANDSVLSVEHSDARMMSSRFFQGESRKAHDG